MINITTRSSINTTSNRINNSNRNSTTSNLNRGFQFPLCIFKLNIGRIIKRTTLTRRNQRCLKFFSTNNTSRREPAIFVRLNTLFNRHIPLNLFIFMSRIKRILPNKRSINKSSNRFRLMSTLGFHLFNFNNTHRTKRFKMRRRRILMNSTN